MKSIHNKLLKYKDVYIIFYSDSCGYSTNALELLRNNKLKYKGYEIENIPGGFNFLLSKLKSNKQITNFDENHTTRPIIFYKGKFIGGYTELSNHVSKNKNK
jgi:glutaredoxin